MPDDAGPQPQPRPGQGQIEKKSFADVAAGVGAVADVGSFLLTAANFYQGRRTGSGDPPKSDKSNGDK